MTVPLLLVMRFPRDASILLVLRRFTALFLRVVARLKIVKSRFWHFLLLFRESVVNMRPPI